MNTIFPGILSVVLLAATAPAAALSLGEIALQSRLGEPLRAEIPLMTEDGKIPASHCFTLATSQQNDLPSITRGSLRVVRRSSTPRLQVLGHGPINEPVFVIAIKAGCGDELQREYVLMPEAPLGASASGSELPLESNGAIAEGEATDTNAPRTRRARKPVPQAEDEGVLPPPRRKSRSAPATDTATGDRLLLGAPEAGASTATSEALSEMNDRLLRMETTLHTLNEEISKLDVALIAAAQKTATDGGLRASQALQTSPATISAPPPPAAAPQPRADQWLELLLTTLLGGALSFGAAMGISRWRDRQRDQDWP